MSKLYGILQSERKTQTTKCGNRFMQTTLNSCENGIITIAEIENNEITFKVYKTGGSNTPSSSILIHEFKEQL